MSEYIIEINHDWKCNEVFTNADDARKYVNNLTYLSEAFLIKKKTEEDKRYAIFAYQQWIDGSYKTVEEAINHADSLGIKSFGIYKEGPNLLSDHVYKRV